jgi:outer membrane protein TolC
MGLAMEKRGMNMTSTTAQRRVVAAIEVFVPVVTALPIRCIVMLLSCLPFSGVMAGQDLSGSVALQGLQLPSTPGVRLKALPTPAIYGKPGNSQVGVNTIIPLPATYSGTAGASSGVRQITLQEAQQQAAAQGSNPLVRLGQLQVEVARQNRLGTISTFFPQIGSTFENFHFNKFMGQLLQVNRPIAGTATTLGLPLTGKDQTLVAVTATQPITPLLQLRQLYKIMLADEDIARAKAGMPVSQRASNVEKTYYELLIAQRQVTFAQVKATETGNKWLLASNSAIQVVSVGDDEELIETSSALAIATTRVKELTASLNGMLGWPSDTELQLVPPNLRFEDITLKEAIDRTLAVNPEILEAEQNVVKARAASTIQKLAYVPVVAAMGGYAYNGNALPLLPRDFSFVGIVATYNVFDFGKREHTIKGANAQVEMAEIALQLAKAKVAATVKSSHLELEHSRQLSELTRRLASAIQMQRTGSEENGAELAVAKRAKAEAEMFHADLDYREALARLKALMGEQ